MIYNPTKYIRKMGRINSLFRECGDDPFLGRKMFQLSWKVKSASISAGYLPTKKTWSTRPFILMTGGRPSKNNNGEKRSPLKDAGTENLRNMKNVNGKRWRRLPSGELRRLHREKARRTMKLSRGRRTSLGGRGLGAGLLLECLVRRDAK